MDIDGDSQLYLQSAASLEPDAQTGHLWHLPEAPTYYDYTIGPMKDAKASQASFQKRCTLLAKNWGARPPSQWLPSELLATTPYSLALLDAVYSASKLSKGLRVAYHSRLLELVNARSHIIVNATTPWMETQITRPGCESIIRERMDGITLADVDCLIQSIKNDSKNGTLKKIKTEQTKFQIEAKQAKALQRVLDRREAKVHGQISLQRELWDDRAGRIDLADIKWSDDQPDDTTVLSKKQLNRLAKSQRRAHAVADAGRKAASLKKIKDLKTGRATTMAQLSDKLKEDDENAWTDNDSDEDDDLIMPHRAMPDPGELEPRRRTKKEVRKNKLGAESQMVDGMEVEPGQDALQTADDPPVDYVVEPPNHSRKPMIRSPKTQKRKKIETAKWYKETLARSVQLPTEKFDFSALPKLESSAQRASIDGMMGALDAMGVMPKQ